MESQRKRKQQNLLTAEERQKTKRGMEHWRKTSAARNQPLRGSCRQMEGGKKTEKSDSIQRELFRGSYRWRGRKEAKRVNEGQGIAGKRKIGRHEAKREGEEEVVVKEWQK